MVIDDERTWDQYELTLSYWLLNKLNKAATATIFEPPPQVKCDFITYKSQLMPPPPPTLTPETSPKVFKFTGL